MTESEAPKKKGGRPRLYPGTEKRPTLTFRVRDRMHGLLSKSAADGERSLSEEIERRLEQSFDNPCSGNDRTASLLKNVAEVISMIESTSNKKWWDDEFTASLCGDIIRGIVNAVLPHKDQPENRIQSLVESENARDVRKMKEEIWNSTVQQHAYDRAISILGGKTIQQAPPSSDKSLPS